jgi:hypothetical protein
MSNPYAALLPVSEEAKSISQAIEHLAIHVGYKPYAIHTARRLRATLQAIDSEIIARKTYEGAHLQKLQALRVEAWAKVEQMRDVTPTSIH